MKRRQFLRFAAGAAALAAISPDANAYPTRPIISREQQTPEALGVLAKADAEKWWPVIKELGIKAE